MQNRTKRRIGVPEILAPAGSMESLKAAVAAGCDAVYMGGSKFGARAYAQNPEEDEMVAAIRYCHLYGVKLYMTVNTLLKEQELQSLPTFLRPYYEAGLDAVIVQDMGVLRVIHQCFPDLDIHASTQMTLTSGMGVDDRLAAYGVTRIVPARELSLMELQQMRQQTKMELEVFVHGALCYCYSGQCLMSSMQGGRSGNRGRCAQPCRMQYDIDGSKRYLLSPKELCALPLLGEMIEAGIDSFKIEGRMKTALYVATVARTYRMAIDDWQKDPQYYKSRIPYYKAEIAKCTYRQYTTGFFFGKPDETTQIYDSNTYIKEYTYLGIVGDEKDGCYRIEQRNKFSVGETIEVMKPNGENIEAEVLEILDEEGNRMESAPHPKQVLYINLGIKLEKYDILRRAEI